MKAKQRLIDEMCKVLDTTDDTVNLVELLKAFYNDAYNQGWSDCFWKSIKR